MHCRHKGAHHHASPLGWNGGEEDAVDTRRAVLVIRTHMGRGYEEAEPDEGGDEKESYPLAVLSLSVIF